MNRAIPLLGAQLDVKRGEECLASALGKAIAPEYFRPEIVRMIHTAVLRAREALAAFPPAIRAAVQSERGNVVSLFQPPGQRAGFRDGVRPMVDDLFNHIITGLLCAMRISKDSGDYREYERGRRAIVGLDLPPRLYEWGIRILTEWVAV